MKVRHFLLRAVGICFAAALSISAAISAARTLASPRALAASASTAYSFQPYVVRNYPASTPSPTAEPTETPPPSGGSYYLWNGGILEGDEYTPLTIHVSTCYTGACLNRWSASLAGDMTGDSYGIEGRIVVGTNNSYRIYFRFLLAQAGQEIPLMTYSLDLSPGTWALTFQPRTGPDPQANPGDALIFEIDRRGNRGWTSLEVNLGGNEGARITAPAAPLSSPAAFPRGIVDRSASDPYALDAADLDGDNDIDAVYLSQSGNYLAWAENDGAQNFSRHIIASGLELPLNNASVQIADLDKDGDADLAGVTNRMDSFAWWENDGSGQFTRHDLSSSYSYPVSITAADLDADSDLDFAVAGAGLAWWENDGAQNFTRHAITSTGSYSWISPVDLDQDADADLLAASRAGSLSWWENDGSQYFSRHAIRDTGSTTIGDRTTLRAVDFDRDGDLDLLSASDFLDELAFWLNDGAQDFTPFVLVTGFDHPIDLLAASLDNDADLDLIAGGFAFAWYETRENSFLRHLFPHEAVSAIVLDDIDRDGDQDILSASKNTDQVCWWENPLIP